jgi:hypothetical protein
LVTTYDLKFHGLAIELDGTDLEVNTDGGDVGLGVGVVGESKEKTRLSDTGVSDEEELEEVVVSERGRVSLCPNFRHPLGLERL